MVYFTFWEEKSWGNYTREVYDIHDDKIPYFLNIYNTIIIKKSQFYIVISSISSG